MEAIMFPRVLDSLRVENVRRTYRIVNCKKQRIKSLCDNKIDIELGHRISGQKPVAPGNRSKNHSKGHSKSVPPLHFLKNAAGNHTAHYKRIINDIMKGNDN